MVAMGGSGGMEAKTSSNKPRGELGAGGTNAEKAGTSGGQVRTREDVPLTLRVAQVELAALCVGMVTSIRARYAMATAQVPAPGHKVA